MAEGDACREIEPLHEVATTIHASVAIGIFKHADEIGAGGIQLLFIHVHAGAFGDKEPASVIQAGHHGVADQRRSGDGADSIDGGEGRDLATYEGSTAGVTVDLLTGSVSGGHAAGDTIQGIEDVGGGDGADSLTGDFGGNRLLGLAGNDTLIGGEGDDLLDGGLGSDSINGGEGYDIVLVTNFYHHFDVQTCRHLAAKIFDALAPNGRMVTLEFVPNEVVGGGDMPF